VTGAAGFIGAAFVQRAIQSGALVLGIDSLDDYYDIELKKARLRHIAHERFRFCHMDICQQTEMADLLQDFQPTEIVHFAAQAGVRADQQEPTAYAASNLSGFLYVLECARAVKVRHMVFASSSSVYGLNSQMPSSPKDPVDHPISLYAATKRANEVMAHAYADLHGLPVTGLRFFTVYGPWGRPDMATYLFTKKILNDQPIEIFNHGEHHRDFAYIDDIVESIYRVTNRPAAPDQTFDPRTPRPHSSRAPFRLYNVGSGKNVGLSEFISLLEDVLGRKAEKIYRDIQPGDVPDTLADIKDFVRDFDYHPQTPLREGLTHFTQWYRDYHKL